MKKTARYFGICLILLATGNIAHGKNTASNFNGAMDDLTAQIVQSLVETSVKKIAILPLPDLAGKTNTLGVLVSEELITRLFLEKKFEVVERNRLDGVLRELALNSTALIQEEDSKKIGKILSVDAILSGTIVSMGDSIVVNSRLIGSESGKVLAVARAEFPGNPQLAALYATYPEVAIVTKSFPIEPDIKPEDACPRWPAQSTRYLNAIEIRNCSCPQLDLLRNEIYARHGKKFDRPDLKAYFELQTWYKHDPNNPNGDKNLNSFESKNIEFTVAYERIVGCRKY